MASAIKKEDFSQDYDNDQSNQDGQFDDDQDQYDDNEGDDEYNVTNNQDDSTGGPEGPKYIRLRGLPWSATHQEILDFLKNVRVLNGSQGIHLITSRWDGKNTGEAYVEVQSQNDVEEARKLNKCTMGHRYIEVFTTNPREAKEAMRKTGSHGNSYVVKLRGLPYSVTEQQIEEFFNGLEIKPDREGILFVMDRRGRATGEAFVQFESQEDTEQALGRNREKIGHRYIEIFRSSLAELKRAATGNGRPGPYDLKDRGANRGNDFGGGMMGGRNNMRGGNDNWGNNSGFGVGANNTLGFNNLPGFTNSGNFGNGFGGGPNNGGNFGNNGNFGIGNNSNGGGGGGGFFGGNNNSRFNNSNGNFGNDFGDFGNFGNNRNNDLDNFGSGGNSRNNSGNFGNFSNFGNFGGGNNSSFNDNGGGNFGPIGGGRSDNDYFTIHMRGLPYSSYENDVFKFFDPIRPANVRINFNKKGLHNGTADVFFDSYEDSQLAMKKHREQMGSRYIELFFDGKSKGNNSGGGGNSFSRRI